MDDNGTALPLDAADREFRDELRAWLDENLVGDFVGQFDRGGPDDDDNWELRRAWERKLGEGNWLGLSWPRRYGGREATLTQEILFAMEYAESRRSPAGRLPRRDADGAHRPALRHRGAEGSSAAPDGQRRGRLVPGLLRAGRRLRPRQHLHRARLDGDEWLVNGQKVWTTFAHHADWMFAIVRTEPGSTRHAGLSYLLIPLYQPGVHVVPIRTMLGDSGFNEVFFEDARTTPTTSSGRPVRGGRPP